MVFTTYLSAIKQRKSPLGQGGVRLVEGTRRVDPAVPQDGHLHASRKEGRKEAQYAVVACRQTEIERLTDTSARLVKHPSVKVIALCWLLDKQSPPCNTTQHNVANSPTHIGRR